MIVSKKEASVETIRKESIDRLDLSFTEADLDSIEKDAVNALERGDADAVIESLALFVELLGYKAPPKAFETGNAKVWGALEKKETGELVFGPIVIYNLVVNTLHLMPQQIGSRDKESIELVHQVSLGSPFKVVLLLLSFSKDFRSRNMRALFAAFALRLRLFRASGVFTKCRQFYICRELFEYRHQFGWIHTLKHNPLFIRNCDHHSPIGSRNFIGKIIARHLVFYDLGSMNAAKRSLDDG